MIYFRCRRCGEIKTKPIGVKRPKICDNCYRGPMLLKTVKT